MGIKIKPFALSKLSPQVRTLLKWLGVALFFIFAGLGSVTYGVLNHADEVVQTIPLDPQIAGRIAAVQHVEETTAKLIAVAVAYSFNASQKSKKPIDPQQLERHLLEILSNEVYTTTKDSLYISSKVFKKRN